MDWLATLVATAVFHVSFAIAPTLFLNDGYSIPMQALGTAATTTAQNETLESFYQSVTRALEAGFRHIDTAACYRTEPYVGKAIADAIARGLVTRDEVFVTTKLWSDKHRRHQVVPALRESLRNLGLDYVDLYLIPIAYRFPNQALNIDYLETWRGMEEARALGLTKSIGVSNFNTTQLTRLLANCRVKPAVNEVEVNPTYTNAQIISLCQRESIAVMGYSPFGSLVPRRKLGYNDLPPNFNDPTLVRIAKKYGKTTAQVVLRYEVDRGVIPISKSHNVTHLLQNIDIFDFQLTGAEVASIRKFNRNLKLFDLPQYKHYPYYPFIHW